jgi:hypothetical protein
MNISEVSIGDLVLVNERPVYVTLAVLNNWSDSIEPIPLIPEILDKNADFHRDEKYYKYYVFSEEIDIHGNSISVEICESRGTVYWTINGNEYGITKLKYVHELQHVLRLCKIGKEIII